ncbi:hypothetical protein H9L12_01075 [Sphingomonas rhizophila]|uniref:Uncharacterized protein n=1 Tax=Sphingomonas rhizophila TaxID=2071607 RepID=A0A7G9SBP6_9SPHN|nr:hypothetical protein [Sphingomonas rhizophila]QNN65271.1 hypothetical protein H9L12_01075 [Sphingomonas rhizophila]
MIEGHKDCDVRSYYAERLKYERQMAETAGDPTVARIHRDMAALYSRSIDQLDRDPSFVPSTLVVRDGD